jgi:hypothetical protein
MKFGRRAFHSLLLLAPSPSAADVRFGFCETEDDYQYNSLLKEAQQLRGRVYLQDGAINAQSLTREGRFIHPHDGQSWHLLIMDDAGRVGGCARYIPHDECVSYSELGVAKSALAHCYDWGGRLRRAIETERATARRRGITFAEVGGWALAEELRYSAAALEIFANVCALAKSFGGAVAITTATLRHRSSSILRKLGGRTLVNDGVALPSYFDPQHNCEMEILSLDSDYPNPKYTSLIEQCLQNFASVPARCAARVSVAYAMSASSR